MPGVVEPRRGVGFAQHSAAGVTLDSLDCDMAAEALVPGAVDGAVTTLADPLADGEPPKYEFAFDHGSGFRQTPGFLPPGARAAALRHGVRPVRGSRQVQGVENPHGERGPGTSMDFFDDEDDDASQSDQPTRESRRVPEPEPEAESTPPPGRREGRPVRRERPRPQPRQRGRRAARGAAAAPAGDDGGNRQQVRTRQFTFLAVTIVVLILLFLAFRGCLNAREERSFKNYVSDLSALTVETKQLSDSFFDAFGGNTARGPSDFVLQQQINGDQGTAEGLLDRAEDLDAPDALPAPRRRSRSPTRCVATRLRGSPTSSARPRRPATRSRRRRRRRSRSRCVCSRPATSSTAAPASRSRQALDDQEIVVEEGVPESEFLPDEPDFLDPRRARRRSPAPSSGGGAPVTPSSRMTAPCTASSSSTTAHPAASGTPEPRGGRGGRHRLEIAVSPNGGDAEDDIDVSVGDFPAARRSTDRQRRDRDGDPARGHRRPTARHHVDVRATVCGEEVADEQP